MSEGPSGLRPPANMLAGQGSPYLAAHADNPIAWRPWTPAALAEARRLNRPVLLSVGYAACHWCHVMAQESFASEAMAATVNSLTVPIKVDREERPDIDGLYQDALQRLGGRRGWPLTLLLRPDGEAFLGGTYFTPSDFRDLILDGADRLARAETIVSARPTSKGGATLDGPALARAAEQVLAAMDPLAGGLRGAPKFPNLPVVELLLRAAARGEGEGYARMAYRSLAAMGAGGLHDHLDGGYARYSVDAHWRTPHYEKMLYDNAQFVGALTLAWRGARTPGLARRIEQTLAWMDRRLSLEDGAFAASLAAEAGGVEGGDQIWTRDEIEQALGADAGFFACCYDVAPLGAAAQPLRRLRDPHPGSAARLEGCLDRLAAVRRDRLMPARDDKVLADWNALAIRALAGAALALDKPAWLARARRAWSAVAVRLSGPDGGFWHAPGVPGFLEDYAFLGLAALALFEAGGDPADLLAARGLADGLIARFGRPDGGFNQVSDNSEALVASHAPIADSGWPAGNAAALELLSRLAMLEARPERFTRAAQGVIAAFADQVLADPIAHAGFLNAVDSHNGGTKVTLVGDDRTLLDAVLSIADPAILVTREAGRDGAIGASALICRGQVCDLPQRAPAAVTAALRRSA